MNSTPGCLFLLLLLCLPGLLPAQDTLSSASQGVKYSIPYGHAVAGIYPNESLVLREMAKEVLREPWMVKIVIGGDLKWAVVRDQADARFMIRLSNRKVSGDTVYRKFPVAAYLFPSHLSMKLRWANRADTSGFSETEFTRLPLPDEDIPLYSIPVPRFDPALDTLLIREVSFSYDSLSLRKFTDRITLIHDYYASVALLDSLHQFMTAMDPGVKELLPYNYMKVEEIRSVVDRIESRNFPAVLLPPGYDPEDLMMKYKQVNRDSRSLMYNFMDELRATGAIPWDGNMNRVAAFFTSRIQSYVRRSYLMDRHQGKIYADCLDHFFDRSAFDPGEKIASGLLARMFPGADPDTTGRFVSRRIYDSYRDAALQLISANMFADAFSLMQNGSRFMERNPFLRNSYADTLLLSKAAEGIFNSYTGIASACIAQGKFEMAATYLARADEYAEQYKQYIRSDSAYRKVFSDLFFMRNAGCDELLTQKNYAAALECYDHLEFSYGPRDLARISGRLEEKKTAARIGMSDITAKLTLEALEEKEEDTALFYYNQTLAFRISNGVVKKADPEIDKLAARMAEIRLTQLTEEGATALEKRQYTLAVNRFREAIALADSNGLAKTREFDSLHRHSMKFYLIIRLSASQKKIWANQFESAQVALQQTREAGEQFGLLADHDFIRAMDNFSLKMREQHCRNLQDSVDLRLIRADRAVALRNFISAVDNLAGALAFTKSMPECGIADSDLEETLAKYTPPAGYQKKQLRVQSLVAAGDYSQAVAELSTNQEFYTSHDLKRFGILSEGMFGFIRNRNNPYFTASAVAFFAGRNEAAIALDYLQLAREQGLAADATAEVQASLGGHFAREDFAKDPQGIPAEMAAKHLPADGWFDNFRKSYTAEWSRLKKSIKDTDK